MVLSRARTFGGRVRRVVRPRRPGLVSGEPYERAVAAGEQGLPVDRAGEALGVLREIEAREPSLPGADTLRDFLTLDRVIRRPQLDDRLRTMLPAGLQDDAQFTEQDVSTISAPVAADVVVLAKFDLSEQVKLRAAYGDASRTVAVQPDRANGTSGIGSAVLSYEIVARYSRGLAPELLGHGEVSTGQRYLVEDWVEGTPLTTSERMAQMLPQIVEGLHRVHRGYGVRTASVHRAWGRNFGDRWQEVVRAELVSTETGSRVQALIDADRAVRVSWSHGDLVASNVLDAAGTVVIIDWEHSRVRPLVHDAAKLHQFTADKAPLLELLLAEWGKPQAPGGYTVAEELALMHARFLTRAPSRMVELAGHKRLGIYARQVARQAALLDDVLERL